MIEVHPNLFVGTQEDEASVRGKPEWFVISAAKEPYHRNALGYSGRAAEKTHPEYLIAKRPGRLILNLVDVDNPAYIADAIVDAATSAIHAHIADRKVLLHCNQGVSRSPTLALLYLARFTDQFSGLDHPAAVQAFREIYPAYLPARGMAEYAQSHWPHG